MNIFKIITLSLSIILGLTMPNAFGMKRATPAPTTPEQDYYPSTKQTCGEYRDPHAKKENAHEAHPLPMAQDDDEEDTTMTDEQDDAVIAEVTKQFAAIGIFQSTRFRFLNRVTEAVATRTLMNIVRTTLKGLNKDLADMKIDLSDASDSL
ncbi:MAG: hypothetical protein V1646_04510 [bacterium]